MILTLMDQSVLKTNRKQYLRKETSIRLLKLLLSQKTTN